MKESGARLNGEEKMYEYFVKEVTKVVDGDTIDVIIDLGFDIMFASRVRLAGIDTPESRTADKHEKACFSFHIRPSWRTHRIS